MASIAAYSAAVCSAVKCPHQSWPATTGHRPWPCGSGWLTGDDHKLNGAAASADAGLCRFNPPVSQPDPQGHGLGDRAGVVSVGGPGRPRGLLRRGLLGGEMSAPILTAEQTAAE
jgi:hypothetical protein